MNRPPVEIWSADNAASGLRYRAFLPDGWELIVYEPQFSPFEAQWMIRRGGGDLAHGYETTAELAKARALRVYEALR